MEQYLSACFKICTEKHTNCKFVIIQICSVHFLGIAHKDIEACFSDEKAVEYFKSQIMYAINISNISTFFNWLKGMLTITASQYKTMDVNIALKLKNKM